MRRLCLLLLLPLAGCARTALQNAQPRGLEKGLALRELPRRGDARGLTDEKGGMKAVTRSADGRTVDLDSTLEFVPLAEQIRAQVPDTSSAAGVDQLSAEIEKLADVVDDMVEYVRVRDVAFRAYERAKSMDVDGESPAFREANTAFQQAKSAAAAVETPLLAKLAALPEAMAARDEVQARGHDFAVLVEYLNLELAKVKARRDRIVDAATYNLRMEAFLRSPGKEPTPVHLPGYDSLDEGDLVRRDRLGLLLEDDEREQFQKLSKQSHRLAELGNQYLDGQIGLEKVFAGLADTVLAEVGQLAAEIEALRKEIEEGDFQQNVDQLEQSLRDFVQALEDRSEQALEKLETDAETALKELQAGSTTRLIVLASRIQTLREFIEEPSPESIPEAIGLVHAIATDSKAWAEAPEAVANKLEGLLASLNDEALSIPQTVREAMDASGLSDKIDYFANFAERAAKLATAAQGLLELDGELAPLRADLKVPGAIDVSLDAAKPTTLRLRRTPRMDGDSLSLRMTVLEGSGPVGEPLLIDLGLETIGWHARLDPSVILARPDGGIQAGSADFRFAPAVSWLWRYTPPDDATGFWNGVARGTGFGIGPHATFLSFDPNKDVEIGLGLTTSIWNGMLQFGGGYNLMADDNELYMFVGSSLIGILQTMNDS